MKWFATALKLCEVLSRIAIWLGGTSVLAISILIGVEVLLRKFLNVSTGGADELSGYALAISSSWALGFTVIRRAHIRIDAIYTRMSSGFRACLDCLGIMCLTVFAFILTFYCCQLLLDTIDLGARSNTTLGTPLWIPQTLWISGLVLFCVTCALLSIISIHALVTGDQERVSLLVGSLTTEEEIQEDTGFSLFKWSSLFKSGAR